MNGVRPVRSYTDEMLAEMFRWGGGGGALWTLLWSPATDLGGPA